MLLANLLDLMIDRGQDKKNAENPGVHSIESLRLLLREERARSNRSRTAFSFVRFGVQSIVKSDRDVEQFIKVVTVRIRAIDKVGWLDTHSIGVVLPSTSSEGARILADEILRLHNRPELMIDYTIYTYPFNMYDG